jgi:hypothetical protein
MDKLFTSFITNPNLCNIATLQLDRIGGPILDWPDLFRPQLKGQVAMLGAPQEVGFRILGFEGVVRCLGGSERFFKRDVNLTLIG